MYKEGMDMDTPTIVSKSRIDDIRQTKNRSGP